MAFETSIQFDIKNLKQVSGMRSGSLIQYESLWGWDGSVSNTLRSNHSGGRSGLSRDHGPQRDGGMARKPRSRDSNGGLVQNFLGPR